MMIGLRYAFAEYHYVGPEIALEDGVEVCGLQITLMSRSEEACGSFHLVVGQRRNEMLALPKVVATCECLSFEGIVVEEHSEVVHGEVLREWSLRADDTEFYLIGPKLGASVVKLVLFETLEIDRMHTLERVEDVAEFSRRLATYSAHPMTWFQNRLDSSATNFSASSSSSSSSKDATKASRHPTTTPNNNNNSTSQDGTAPDLV